MLATTHNTIEHVFGEIHQLVVLFIVQRVIMGSNDNLLSWFDHYGFQQRVVLLV